MADVKKIFGYDIKDAVARETKLDTYAANANAWDAVPTEGSNKPVLSGGVYTAIKNTFGDLILGVTTTEITDGATTNPITIGGNSVTAVKSNIVVYGKKEFIFDGEKWIEFGDLSGMKALAYKDTASGAVVFDSTSGTDTVTGVTSAGTLPSVEYDAGTESITFSAGTLPTLDSQKTFWKTGVTATVTVS